MNNVGYNRKHKQEKYKQVWYIMTWIKHSDWCQKPVDYGPIRAHRHILFGLQCLNKIHPIFESLKTSPKKSACTKSQNIRQVGSHCRFVKISWSRATAAPTGQAQCALCITSLLQVICSAPVGISVCNPWVQAPSLVTKRKRLVTVQSQDRYYQRRRPHSQTGVLTFPDTFASSLLLNDAAQCSGPGAPASL